MCGIAGIMRVWKPEERGAALATPPARAIPEAWLDILDDSIRHRGPDGQGRFRDRAVRADGSVVDVALVHRRLSIIDHSGGHQPMVWEAASVAALGTPALRAGRLLTRDELDARHARFSNATISATAAAPSPESRSTQRVAVVFNGCIYNHRELRAELVRAGHTFSTDHSDTEVLIHGWREWGHDLRFHLDGMYACAIWVAPSGSVELLRDDFGEKPLYHEAIGDVHAFASTPAALVRLAMHTGLSPRELDSTAWIRSWIAFGWNQAGPWGRIKALQVGTSGQLDGMSTAFSPHWNRSINPSNIIIEDRVVDGMLRGAVHSRLEADAPLGCFLSGGIDSALMAAYALERKPDLRAYTVRMPVAGMDESEAAADTAAALGISHTVLDCDASPADDLVALIVQLGLPFGDSSLLPTHWVSRAARREVAVALSGDGGDELFMGYERHAALPVLHGLERLNPAALGHFEALLPEAAAPRTMSAKMRRLIDAARYGGYKELVAIFPSPYTWKIGLCAEGSTGWGATGHFGMTTKAHRDADDGFATVTALRFDRLFYLPEDLLRKSDTASMACGLEVRAPFLERTLATAAMDAPKSCLMPRNQRKGLLKQVARRYLPADIVNRPKQGFAIPIGEWFRTDYGGLRTMLLDHLNSAEPFGPPSLGIDLNMAYVKQMLDEHLGAGPSGVVKRDHSQRLYMLLVLSIWAKWLGGMGGMTGRSAG